MNYEPGTVAVATVRGVPNVRVFRVEAYCWRSVVECGGNVTHYDYNGGVTDVRPLVVLDPEDAAHCLTALRLAESQEQSVTARLLLHSVIGKIEAQTKPPRIPEPGLWGVVEAKSPRDAGTLVNDGAGWLDSFGRHFEWDELIDPVLVRPGIEDES